MNTLQINLDEDTIDTTVELPKKKERPSSSPAPAVAAGIESTHADIHSVLTPEDYNTTLSPDFSLMSPLLRQQVEPEVNRLLRDPALQQRVRKILSENPEQKHIDINKLLTWQFSSPAESIAVSTILEDIITKRWETGNYILECDPGTLDLGLFDKVPLVDYEFMPTRVLPQQYDKSVAHEPSDVEADALRGTLAKLLIQFPAGAEEAEKPHFHPGGRIILSIGKGRFNSKYVPGGELPLEHGTVVLMPRNTSHNFAAYPEQDWTALSLHLPYAGIGNDAIQYEEE